jgi:hypothetical protein
MRASTAHCTVCASLHSRFLTATKGHLAAQLALVEPQQRLGPHAVLYRSPETAQFTSQGHGMCPTDLQEVVLAHPLLQWLHMPAPAQVAQAGTPAAQGHPVSTAQYNTSCQHSILSRILSAQRSTI